MREAILDARRRSPPPKDARALAAAIKVSYRDKTFLAVLEELNAEEQGNNPDPG
jgi:hypothetical protein